ncbi:MAG TPA: histidine kinase dimerization/phosphoacceptor domain -containing protein [bacterium]|nr:histidine kinase dimerization/phosphoacceptor domain -containing protein [bacterium]
MDDAGRRIILLVEDEAIIAMDEASRLEAYDYTVMIAANGERAVQMVCHDNAPVDLVLMDINLGDGMDGTEAATIIHDCRDIPVLFLSSHTEPEIVNRTEKVTNYGYVVKNSSLTVLDASIKMAFRLFDANRSIRDQKMEIESAYGRMQAANEELQATQDDLIEHAKALNESEKTFRSLFEKGPIGTAYHRMVYDHDGKPQNYVILEANPAYERMTGTIKPAGRLVTEVFLGIEHDPFDWISTYGNVARTGKEIRFQQHLEFNDRWYEIVAYQNKPDHFVTTFFEITERKRMEEELRKSEQKFRDTVWDMQVGVLLQGPHAEILLSNPKALELLGLTEDQILGRTSFDPSWNVIHEDGSPFPGPTHPVPMSIATMSPILGAVMGVARHAVGDRVWLAVDAVPQLDENGAVRQVVCTFVDVTERKTAETKVVDLLREKEILLKEVQHRIKNNMNILASLLRLQAEALKNQEAKDALEAAVNRISSMMVLYDKLYRSDTVGSISMHDYLPELVREIVGNMSTGEPIDVRTDIEDIMLDEKRLSSLGIIVNELMTNSMKYAFKDTADGHIRLTARRMGGRIRLLYEDNGVGLVDAAATPEADPPVDVGRSPRMEGFGLHLVAMLAQQLDGTLEIERHSGARFVIEFNE